LLLIALTGRPDGSGGLTFFMTLVVGLPLSYALCVFVGLPAHVLLRRRGWTSIWTYVAAGGLVTIPAAAGLLLWMLPTSGDTTGWPVVVLPLTIIAVGGPVAACAFWFQVRPDQNRDRSEYLHLTTR
jgi:hypothetical protein